MLKTIHPLIMFIFLPLLSLSQKPEPHNSKLPHFPFIIDLLPKPTEKSIKYSTIASEARFVYTGKYADTIKLSSDTKPYFNSKYKTYRDSLGVIWFYIDSVLNKSGLEIFVDPSQHLSLDRTPFPSTVYNTTAGYTVDSAQTKKNYEEWLKKPRRLVEAVPVFITNNTSDTVYLDYQDLNAFMIQEAMDVDGKWKPIEYWQYSKCGNSYRETAIQPNHLIVVKITRHSGSFTTWLRVKLLNGGKITYSNAFKGAINKEQFAPDTLINVSFGCSC